MTARIKLTGAGGLHHDPLTTKLLDAAREHGGVRSVGSAVVGAAVGAAAVGGAVGSIIPAFGTAVGAAIGGVGGAVGAVIGGVGGWVYSALEIVFSSPAALIGFLTVSASLVKEWLRARAKRSITVKSGATTITIKGSAHIDDAIRALQQLPDTPVRKTIRKPKTKAENTGRRR
jgi:hypothetical protein